MSWPADTHPTGLEPGRIVTLLNDELPRAASYWIAYSGGVDSSVLLHLMAAVRERLGAPVTAVHVDHGLQRDSGLWAEHCARQCAAIGMPLVALAVDARARSGQSPEAAARAARYAAIGDAMQAGDMLLTAHHLEDQAETVLLQMLRGAGVEGLSAMPLCRDWYGRWLVRPLLAASRDEILAWARARGIGWVDDPSNADSGPERNYLRHTVLPALTARWPAAARSLARSAHLCAQAAQTVAEQADADLTRAGVDAGARLRIDVLCALEPARAANLLRRWLRARGAPALPAARLDQALHQLCQARADAQPLVTWSGHALRRFRGEAWLVSGETVAAPQTLRRWDGRTLDLGPGLGRLECREAAPGIDPGRWRRGVVEVGYRRPGMRFRPAGAGASRDFKRLAHECGIPPWLRDRVPVIFIDGEPAALAGCCVCEPFTAGDRTGCWPVWVPPS